MPQNLMSMRTSLGPSARRSICNGSSGAVASGAPKARAVVVVAAVKARLVVSVMATTIEARAQRRGTLPVPPSPAAAAQGATRWIPSAVKTIWKRSF
jgi:hypothetical protein